MDGLVGAERRSRTASADARMRQTQKSSTPPLHTSTTPHSIYIACKKRGHTRADQRNETHPAIAQHRKQLPTLIGSDTARIAGVPSSLLKTLSASQPVTNIPPAQHPVTRIIGFAPDGTSSMRRRVATTVAIKPGAVLIGSLG